MDFFYNLLGDSPLIPSLSFPFPILLIYNLVDSSLSPLQSIIPHSRFSLFLASCSPRIFPFPLFQVLPLPRLLLSCSSTFSCFPLSFSLSFPKFSFISLLFPRLISLVHSLSLSLSKFLYFFHRHSLSRFLFLSPSSFVSSSLLPSSFLTFQSFLTRPFVFPSFLSKSFLNRFLVFLCKPFLSLRNPFSSSLDRCLSSFSL